MLLTELVDASGRIASVTGRLEKIAILVECLRRLGGEEVDIGVSYLSGRLRQGRIGIGGALIRSASGGPSAPKPSLNLVEVDRELGAMAELAGAGSSGARSGRLAALLRRATAAEADFLIRLLVGELRQGASAGLMEEAVAKASGAAVQDVRRAMMLSGDIEAVARAALREGPAALGRFHVAIFQPLAPMLAQPVSDLPDALERLGEAALEYKIDGARIQVHKSGDLVRVFSRSLSDVTEAVPEVVEAVRALGTRELVLDGEVIALRPDGTPHPFQVTMRRFGRRLDVERLRAELPVTPWFFDALRLEGRDLFDLPALERFAALHEAAPALAVPQRVTSDPREAEAFLAEALRRGHEGVMIKDVNALYEAGRRGGSWLKLKPAHTLDLVVLAAEWGHGRRKGWLSNIHLGARDPGTGGFVMLGKTFKGMTDEMLARQTRRFQELKVAEDGCVVHLRPELVVEVAFNDVQESPHYPAGLALRFARVKRYREDKRASEADTLETVRTIHRAEAAAHTLREGSAPRALGAGSP